MRSLDKGIDDVLIFSVIGAFSIFKDKFCYLNKAVSAAFDCILTAPFSRGTSKRHYEDYLTYRSNLKA